MHEAFARAAATARARLQVLRDANSNQTAVRASVQALREAGLHRLLAPLNAESAQDFTGLLLTDKFTVEAPEASEQGDDDSESWYEPDAGWADYMYLVGDKHVRSWEYLGPEWTTWVRELHALPVYTAIPEITLNLHSYQLTGINKLVALAQSSFKGGILGDAMGLGKTLTAIGTGIVLQKMFRGCFNLVVTPKSCITQWKREIEFNVHPKPKVVILDNAHTTCKTLLDEKPDWVLCTPHRLANQHQRLRKYMDAMNRLDPRTKSAAEKDEFFRNAWLESRPVATLLSSVYEDMGRPINCLIVDEAHMAKNEETQTYQALKAVPAQHIFLLSGTIFGNKWYDIYALNTFMKGHPFMNKKAFMKAFAERDTFTAGQTRSQEDCLVLFQQACTVMRPADSLQLPDLERRFKSFVIADKRVENIITYLIKIFYQCILKSGGELVTFSKTGDNDGEGDVWKNKAVYCITLAQLYAANPKMLRPNDVTFLARIEAQAVKEAAKFVDMFGDEHGVGTANYYHAIVKYLETYHNSKAEREQKRKARGRRAGKYKRQRLDPEVAIDMAEKHGEELAQRFAPAEEEDVAADDNNESHVTQEDDEDVNMEDAPQQDTEVKDGDETLFVSGDEDEVKGGADDNDSDFIPEDDEEGGGDDDDDDDDDFHDDDEDDDDADAEDTRGIDLKAADEEMEATKQEAAQMSADDADNARDDMEEKREAGDRDWEQVLAALTPEQVRSPRVVATMDKINEVRASHPGEKLLVFSRYKMFLDLVDKEIDAWNSTPPHFQVSRFDGSVPSADRQGVIDQFSRPCKEGQTDVMLITAGCGGAGLNLAQASHVILCEPWWRDMDVRQAIARAFRQGQKLTVHVWYVFGDDSLVDLVLWGICQKKAISIEQISRRVCRKDGEKPDLPKLHKCIVGA